MDDRMNLDKVDYEREENLPPSALLSLGLGLLIAVGTILFAGIGAIIAATNGESGVVGGVIGAITGAVLPILFVTIESSRLAHRGR